MFREKLNTVYKDKLRNGVVYSTLDSLASACRNLENQSQDDGMTGAGSSNSNWRKGKGSDSGNVNDTGNGKRHDKAT